MNLTGAQSAQLHQALLHAFPSENDLARMVRFGLNENLNAIAGGGGLNEIVFRLIEWAAARGRLGALVTAARQANPGNSLLREFAESLPGTSTEPTVSSSTGGPASPADAKGVAAPPIELFYSYSHKDARLREKLDTHLALLRREGVIQGWHDRMITAGSDWKGAIDTHLESAQVILLLVSASFLASDYCYDIEMTRALERHAAGEARVIPVILRDTDWSSAPFAALQALPTDGRAVTGRAWRNQDEAFTDVARGIRTAVREMARR